VAFLALIYSNSSHGVIY
jgi:hypothetical protein